MTIVRSPQSIDDIFGIWLYISERNEEAADALIDRIDAKLKLLDANPLLGWERSELAVGLRSIPIGKYVLLYRPIDNGVELVRVLHGARDLKRIIRR